MLKTTKEFPPGGFPYTERNPKRDFPGMVPFTQQVASILEYRTANNIARATHDEVVEDLDSYTCQRLGNDSTYCVDLVAQKKTPLLSHLVAAVSHVVESFRSTAKGARILGDWFGDGAIPVSSETSQNRADICTGRLSGVRCPYNSQAPKPFTGKIAENIREQVAAKNHLALTVQGEDTLGECQICGCVLNLKVHVPIRTIYNRSSDEDIKRFPTSNPNCWIRSEIATLLA